MRIKNLFLATALSGLILSSCQQQVESVKADTKETAVKTVTAAPVASTTPIILPGAPGQSSQTLAAEDAVKIADTSYSPDDVAFMQNMIPHHAQAVDMANLVAERTNRDDCLLYTSPSPRD